MQYEISAKPTMYQGRLYRSRHEARFAAFYTLSGIAFEYEPYAEFAGWLPDFLIYPNGQPIYLEVKPNFDGMCEAFDKVVLASDKAFTMLACTIDQPAWLFCKRIPRKILFNLDQQDLWIQAANEVMYLKPQLY